MTDLATTTTVSMTSAVDGSTHDALHRLALEYVRLANAHDVEAMTVLHAPGFVAHTRRGKVGIENYRALLNGLFTAFPDALIAPIHLIVEGDRLVLHVETTATNTGADFVGEPVSGKRVRFTGLHVLRIEGGKIAESWGLLDTTAFLDQLR